MPLGNVGQYQEITFIVTTRGCYLLSRLRPGMLLNILLYTECPTAEHHPAPDVSPSEVENPWSEVGRSEVGSHGDGLELGKDSQPEG